MDQTSLRARVEGITVFLFTFIRKTFEQLVYNFVDKVKKCGE